MGLLGQTQIFRLVKLVEVVRLVEVCLCQKFLPQLSEIVGRFEEVGETGSWVWAVKEAGVALVVFENEAVAKGGIEGFGEGWVAVAGVEDWWLNGWRFLETELGALQGHGVVLGQLVFCHGVECRGRVGGVKEEGLGREGSNCTLCLNKKTKCN